MCCAHLFGWSLRLGMPSNSPCKVDFIFLFMVLDPTDSRATTSCCSRRNACERILRRNARRGSHPRARGRLHGLLNANTAGKRVGALQLGISLRTKHGRRLPRICLTLDAGQRHVQLLLGLGRRGRRALRAVQAQGPADRRATAQATRKGIRKVQENQARPQRQGKGP